jgi:hypothetical protein
MLGAKAGLAALLFAYVWYTAWVVLSPLVSPSHPIHALFPDRYWGLAVPVACGVTLLSVCIGVYWRHVTE